MSDPRQFTDDLGRTDYTNLGHADANLYCAFTDLDQIRPRNARERDRRERAQAHVRKAMRFVTEIIEGRTV